MANNKPTHERSKPNAKTATALAEGIVDMVSFVRNRWRVSDESANFPIYWFCIKSPNEKLITS